jgi:hypothetical protein
LSILFLKTLGSIIVPGSIVMAIGLNPKYLARISEKLLSTPPDKATTA